jgi:hypothetical protein
VPRAVEIARGQVGPYRSERLPKSHAIQQAPRALVVTSASEVHGHLAVRSGPSQSAVMCHHRVVADRAGRRGGAIRQRPGISCQLSPGRCLAGELAGGVGLAICRQSDDYPQQHFRSGARVRDG